MNQAKHPMTQQEWLLVKKWFNELLEIKPDEVADMLTGLTSDPKLQQVLMTMLDVYHQSSDQTITPKRSAAEAVVLQYQLNEGDLIDRYQVKQVLGFGGMGQVYLAERNDEVIQQVAIKVLAGHRLDEQAQIRFDIERRILASLEHPNIARLIDAGTINESPYYVMEYVDGVPIDVYCRTLQVSLDTRLDLFRKICDAVSYAHNNLVVHRDLKPSNILVNAEGEIKLLDFGIAKPLKILPGTNAAHETLIDSMALTPQYAAPEQIQGQAITVACDIYVLGLLLYQIITDQHAFDLDGKSWGQIEQTINDQIPSLPSQAVKKSPQTEISWQQSLKGDLDAIVAHALKKEPEQRYTNVKELADDIAHFQANEPIEIKRDHSLYRLKKFLRRNWLPLGAITGLFVIMAISSVWIWQQSETIKIERDKAVEERKSADETANFLVSIFEYSDETRAPGTDLTAVEVLELAAEKLMEKEHKDPVTYRLVAYIGRVFWNMRKFKEASMLLDQIDVSGIVARDVDKINILVLKARLAQDNMGKESRLQAIDYFTEALLFLSNGDVLKTEILLNLANNYRLINDFDMYEKTLALAKHELYQEMDQQSLDFAGMQNMYAKLLSMADYDPNHVKLMINSLHVMEQHMEPHDLRLANTLYDIAYTYLQNYDDFENGEVYLKKAEKIYRTLSGDNYPKFTGIMGLYALLYKNQGEYQLAIDAYQASLKYETSKETNSPTKVGVLLHNIAITHLENLEDYVQAESYFRQAMDSLLEDNDESNTNYLWFRIGYTLARSHLPEHQHTVEQEFLDLFAIYEPIEGFNFARGRTLVGLADFYHRTGRTEEAIDTINKGIEYLVAYKGEGSQQHNYALELLAKFQAEPAQ